MEGKKKREMTPEMLEKLALAREKAQEVRRQIKAEKDAKALEELPQKLERQAKIKEELAKPEKPKPETRTKKPPPEHNPVMDSPTSDSDDYSYEEPKKELPKKEKKKKKQIVVMEDSSSDEEQFIYVPKRRGRPQNPKAKDLPEVNITPAVSVEDYSTPPPPPRPKMSAQNLPVPPQPVAPREPSYAELARQNLANHRFGGFPRF